MANKHRDRILSSVKRNKPAFSPLPEMPLFEREDIDKLTVFAQLIESSGGAVIRLAKGETLENVGKTIVSGYEKVISTTDKIQGNTPLSDQEEPSLLDGVDLAIIEGDLGVSENGAIWVTEGNMGMRVLPFITQHLVVLLKAESMVGNMAEAYERIQVDKAGFGLFIAGPSKTADIEQSLVIGAQGARSFRVVII